MTWKAPFCFSTRLDSGFPIRQIFSTMRSILIALCLMASSTVAFSQQAAPSGSVFGQRARFVASAPIEATNVDTGMKLHVESGVLRLYRLTELPPGDYELSISITGAGTFVQKRTAVTAASPVRLDIIDPLG